MSLSGTGAKGVVALATLAVVLVAAPSAGAVLTLVPEGTFTKPVYASSPRGDTTGLFVVERAGKIRILRNGTILPQPFLDVTAEVDDSDPENGMQSIAFATDYSQTGLFYVFMTPRDANPGVAPFAPIQIREYRRSQANADVADPTSARVLLTIPHPSSGDHYGDSLAFGPDGRLYIGTGDGGGVGDPNGNAANLESRLGKLLRIDPRRTETGPYGVPFDNPYVGVPGDDLIWSWGLRNPFRFSFDRQTGALNIADVGQDAREEIDFAPQPSAGRALNFGWNACEGRLAYPGPGLCFVPGATPPVLDYSHAATGCGASITGGAVVRDPGLEELAGRYIYGDYCRTAIRSAVLGLPAATGDQDTGLAVAAFTLVALAEDACGRIHVVQASGPVSRISDGSPGACAPLPEFTAGPPDAPRVIVPKAPAGPKVTLGGKTRQRVLRSRALSLRVRCERPCSLRVLGTVTLPGKDPRLPDRTRRRATGTVTVKVPVARGTRARIGRALRRGSKVRANLTIRARDEAGRLTVAKRSIRITG